VQTSATGATEPGACPATARLHLTSGTETHAARIGAGVRSDCTGTSRRRRHGFTLIEILVVLVIIGVVLGTVTLAVGGSGERELENAARRAQARIALACERAVLGGHDIGFSLVEEALRFGYITPQGWQPFGPRSGEELRERSLGDGVAIELSRDGLVLANEDEAAPQLACFSSGELTPFEMRLSRADVARQWQLRGRLDGRMETEASDVRGF
jgi:general secretion pathway protein H